MAMSIDFRWKVPTVSGQSADAEERSRGLQTLGAGIGTAIGNWRKEQRDKAIRELAQSNWQKQFDAAEAQRKLSNEMQGKQFAEQVRLNNANLARMSEEAETRKKQQEWLQRFYDTYVGEDPEEKEYRQLYQELYGEVPSAPSIDVLLNPGLKVR